MNIANNTVNKINNTLNILKSKNNTNLNGPRMIIILFLILGFIIIGYLSSSSYRVSATYNQLNKYNNILFIDYNYLNNKDIKNRPLKDFSIATSFRPYLCKYQMFDYVSDKLVRKTLMSGARCLFIDIFNNSFGKNAEPVISSGYEKGNWKLTLNTLSFDKLCQTIAETAFTSGYVNNYNDPLILLLNLKTNRNYFSIQKIQKTIFKYFKDRLLGSKYSFQKTDMSNVPIKELMGKVLIFTSGGYENTSLEELINFSWDKDNINKISYKSLSSNLEDLTTSIKLNINDVRETNKNNLTLVVPNEDAFFTNNYNTDKFFSSNCQMIAMNYQYFDTNMQKYIQKFKTSSFILNQ